MAERRARERLAAAVNTGSDQGPAPDRIDVVAALGRLPRRQREATVLRYYMRMDVAEIALALGVSDGTVKSALYRARATLARELDEEADEEEPVARDR
jgi:RNA polymerase sigma factor (sigma-70 family)